MRAPDVGVIAVYAAVPAGVAGRLGDVDPDEVGDYIDRVLGEGAPSVDIDETWDGLHFLLAGRPATDPVEDDALSEAVVGVYEFDSDVIVGVTPVAELARIVDALEAVDLDGLLGDVDWSAFAAADVYPGGWNPDAVGTLRDVFADVLNIHRLCLADGLDLMVAIS
ncbi:DUF1877 family protein [Gordonia humi]|uniref:DUF1877 family protein n=1 Tax=Gordonia humi TaxID=686429 RepID=A0A840ETH5_9ACTN|nr:DUF1877 family protein [Gordonia humi]MBB4135002.1 hypothetical protein [Gordonia humi]